MRIDRRHTGRSKRNVRNRKSSNPVLTHRPLEGFDPTPKWSVPLCFLQCQFATWCAVTEPLCPDGKLDVTAAPGLHAALLDRKDQDVQIDMTDVTLIGALCLQTLIAAARSAHEGHHDFQISNTSDLVLAQMAAMGMTPEQIAEGYV